MFPESHKFLTAPAKFKLTKNISQWLRGKPKGIFGILRMVPYLIQKCFICRPSDSTVSEDAGVEPRNVESSVVDPWHFSVDSDPDTRIHASD